MIIKDVGKYILQITDIEQPTTKKDNSILVQGCYKMKHIPSVNTQYLIHDNRKILDPAVKEERRQICSHLWCSGYKRDCIPLDCKLTIELGFYLNHSLNQRDTDNMLKFSIDTLAEYFKFNDNIVYNIACYKRQLLNADKELVHFKIKKYELEKVEMSKIDMRLIK